MEPGDNFDQTGFELPTPPQAAPADAGQSELFSDDYSQPDATDGEPVFWSESSAASDSAEDFYQADAQQSV